QVIANLVNKLVPPDQVTVILGGREENSHLLEEEFDYIFFTGGTAVGKLVMQKAADHLTPITLELGGKSPCIIDESADLDLAAKRIAFGKGINAGQTCVAPDYLLVHESVKDKLLPLIRDYWLSFYGNDPIASSYWPKIVNKKHYDRLMKLLENTTIFCGGKGDGEHISPTLMTDVDWGDTVMQEEIFGPVLPVLTFKSIEDAVEQINKKEQPLSCYVFCENQDRIQALIAAIPFGGGCITDTLIQLSNPHLPFGGRGKSGMGRYHGKCSFDTFSHSKSILFKGKIDFPFRYMPLDEHKTSLLKQFLK
ncbi:MAG: aldehyde dehydrogenase family protein, partial [Clostridiales bacterium]|nr:aldehyde dehydrogenase family protein [Clostridiales bacterium]